MVEVTPEKRRLALPKMTSGKGSLAVVVMAISVHTVSKGCAHVRPKQVSLMQRLAVPQGAFRD